MFKSIKSFGNKSKNNNDKYSYKDFKNNNFLSLPASEFNNIVITGSSFFQDQPYTTIFRSDIINIKFIKCNLDNCILPTGSILQDCTNKHFREQNDQEMWVVDEELNPISPLNECDFDKCKINKNPNKIPVIKVDRPITIQNDPDRIETKKIEDVVDNKQLLKQILKDNGYLNGAKIIKKEVL